MATEAIKLITGMGDVLLGRVAVVDALSLRIHEVPLTPDASDADDDAPAASADAGPLPPAAGDHGPLGEGTAPSLPRTVLDVDAFEPRRAHAGGSLVVLVDVRDPGEAGQNRLPGAVNLPISVLLQAGRGTGNGTALASLLSDAGVAPESDLVTYCSAGVRAARATRLFA